MGEVLALALAIAASPFPVVPAILLLFTARPRPTSLSFLGGWMLGIAAPTTVFVLLADVIDATGAAPTWLSWVRLALGAVLIGYGFRQWARRHADSEPPGWTRSIESSTPLSALRLALVLSVPNPKVVLLAAAAGLDIGAAELTASATVGTVVAFTMVAAVSVAVPVLGYALLGERLLGPLARVKDWLLRSMAAVMALVIMAIGLILVKNGLAGL
jgi:threonine/homoserine/homoserine lactone efflux protein